MSERVTGFCLQCGPDVSTVVDAPAKVRRCARCGWESPLAQRPLYVVAGVSGSGKTTVSELLPALLPEFLVFDVDLTLHIVALGWEVWRDTWLQLAHAIALNGQTTVLCGTFTPDQLARLPSRPLIGDIRFCLLDAPDAAIQARLAARPEWRGSTPDFIEKQLSWARRLRTEVATHIDTGTSTEKTAAMAVADWIRGAEEPPHSDIHADLGFTFWWDIRKLWTVDLPVVEMRVAELEWLLDLPFWDDGPDELTLSARDVAGDRANYRVEYERAMAADLSYPINTILLNGRWVIMDGIHRLLKAWLLGHETILTKQAHPSDIPKFSRRWWEPSNHP
jgi:hypothetical protein